MAAHGSDRWNGTQAAWLALAVLAHALLLLLPVGRVEFSAVTPSVLKISIAPLNRTVQKAAIAPPPTAANTPQAQAKRPAADDTAMAAATPTAENPPEAQSAAENAPEHVTLPGLLQSLEQARLDEPRAPAPRRLGAHPQAALPAYWRSRGPGALPSDAGFSDMAPPARTGIVDRWLAADGSHNVVVDLPNGEKLCGRATAWDPLQPLVENVMHFRYCGSAEQWTFKLLAQKIRSSISRIE